MTGTFVAGNVVLAAPYTGGVQDTGLFELDANTLDTSCTAPADWAALFTADPAGTDEPCASDGWSFVADGVGSADTTYWSQGGSKDAYDPALGPWLYKSNDVSPDKNDIVNAFAAAYHITDGTDITRFLFFGADRFNTSGDAQMGFQFLQADTCLAAVDGVSAGGTAACPGTTPNQAANSGKFVDPTTGVPVHHINGDLLVLVNFNNGGVLGLAGVFVWSGADGAGAGSYGQVIFGSGANCLTITSPNNFCSTANTGNLTSEPVWPYTAKNQKGQPVTTYTASAFIEGGVNLGAIANAGTCFPSFIAETRSAAGPSSGLSLTAQLKDLAFGKFETCGSTLVTTPKDGSGANIPGTGLSIGTGTVQVKDSAQLDVTGINAWSGTLDFYLCGPSVTTCDTDGVHIGSQIAVSQATVMPVVSAAATVTSAGTYCWAGVFDSTTTGVPDQTDASSGECFTVNPVTPTLSTTASADVTLGNPITDTASLTGTANQPGTNGPNATYPSINANNGAAAGGTITFTVQGPDSCAASGLTVTGSPVAVSGDNASYGPVSATPTVIGKYTFVASYSGNSPNTNAAGPSSCPPTASDGDEEVTVTGNATLSTTQDWLPNDTAKVEGPTNLTGKLTFTLYDDGTCGDDGGTSQYTEDVTVTNAASGTEFSTSNTSVKVTATGDWSWLVSYDDDSLGDPEDSCESTSLTIAN